ncbi:hypothetical protein [Azospirillum canadense]|uniref:hypothetical protein n=1 Tax=Azospirillum canadense TaxID=403962 RepID=UPI002226261A|nr:hypothetical protein [Azospirillum canadense]MCW2239137.1 hypothetical protein [Azospirillum canadense]
MHKTVVALYDSRADAQEARGELERAGFAGSAITIEVSVERHPVTQQSPDHRNRGSRTDNWGMVPGEPAFQERTMRPGNTKR